MALVASLLVACSPAADEPDESAADAVKVDTSGELARKQHEVNVAFARAYTPRCTVGSTSKPRVLLTGFAFNATGQMVSELVPAARLSGRAPRYGEVAAPASQLAVGTRTVHLAGADGDVEVCAMVLPIFWDLADALIAREVETFAPSFVMMNGIGAPRQAIWLELGAANLAALTDDGSSHLVPVPNGTNDGFAPLIPSAPAEEYLRPNLLSWSAVALAGRAAITRLNRAAARSEAFGDIVQGVAFPPYPRGGNAFVCNNITYTVGYLMDHPGETVRLLEASHPSPGKPSGLDAVLPASHSDVPRVFAHWPGEVAGGHVAAGAEVMAALVGAQVGALQRGDVPTRGDLAQADASLRGGATF